MKQLLICILVIFSLPVQAQTPSIDDPALQELKKRLHSSLIVGLGEAGHGFESINDVKSALVRVLHKELNFEAIAFESSFTESVVSFLVDSTLDSRATNFLYPFWNTTPVKAALEPFFHNEQHGQKPLIMGFDIQEDCRYSNLSQVLMDKKLVSDHKDKLIECDSVLSYYIGAYFSRKGALPDQEYLLLVRNYELIAAEVKTKSTNSLQMKLLERSLENRMWLCKYLTITTATEKMYYRDSLMADNIAWLQKELYEGSRFMVWAANTHIAKKTHSRRPEWTGEWLSSGYGDRYFAVSFRKGPAGSPSFWKGTSYRYSSGPFEKFDLVFYLDKLIKIKTGAWITPCR
jgi:erythromycin esterase